MYNVLNLHFSNFLSYLYFVVNEDEKDLDYYDASLDEEWFELVDGKFI